MNLNLYQTIIYILFSVHLTYSLIRPQYRNRLQYGIQPHYMQTPCSSGCSPYLNPLIPNSYFSPNNFQPNSIFPNLNIPPNNFQPNPILPNLNIPPNNFQPNPILPNLNIPPNNFQPNPILSNLNIPPNNFQPNPILPNLNIPIISQALPFPYSIPAGLIETGLTNAIGKIGQNFADQLLSNAPAPSCINPPNIRARGRFPRNANEELFERESIESHESDEENGENVILLKMTEENKNLTDHTDTISELTESNKIRQGQNSEIEYIEKNIESEKRMKRDANKSHHDGESGRGFKALQKIAHKVEEKLIHNEKSDGHDRSEHKDKKHKRFVRDVNNFETNDENIDKNIESEKQMKRDANKSHHDGESGRGFKALQKIAHKVEEKLIHNEKSDGHDRSEHKDKKHKRFVRDVNNEFLDEVNLREPVMVDSGNNFETNGENIDKIMNRFVRNINDGELSSQPNSENAQKSLNTFDKNEGEHLDHSKVLNHDISENNAHITPKEKYHYDIQQESLKDIVDIIDKIPARFVRNTNENDFNLDEDISLELNKNDEKNLDIKNNSRIDSDTEFDKENLGYNKNSEQCEKNKKVRFVRKINLNDNWDRVGLERENRMNIKRNVEYFQQDEEINNNKDNRNNKDQKERRLRHLDKIDVNEQESSLEKNIEKVKNEQDLEIKKEKLRSPRTIFVKPLKMCSICGLHPDQCKCKVQSCSTCGLHPNSCSCQVQSCSTCGLHPDNCNCKVQTCSTCGLHPDNCNCKTQTCSTCGLLPNSCNCKVQTCSTCGLQPSICNCKLDLCSICGLHLDKCNCKNRLCSICGLNRDACTCNRHNHQIQLVKESRKIPKFFEEHTPIGQVCETVPKIVTECNNINKMVTKCQRVPKTFLQAPYFVTECRQVPRTFKECHRVRKLEEECQNIEKINDQFDRIPKFLMECSQIPYNHQDEYNSPRGLRIGQGRQGACTYCDLLRSPSSISPNRPLISLIPGSRNRFSPHL